MSLASINFQKVSSNSSAHNNRDSKITYLLDHDSSNNEHLFFNDFNDKKIEYINQYKKVHKQKMQNSQVENIVKEAVVNIEKHHSIKDIKNLFLQLENELNDFREKRAFDFKVENEKLFKCFKPKTINKNRIKFNIHEISIHKDEGVFVVSDLNIENLNYDSRNFKWFDNLGNDVTNKVEILRPSKDIFFNHENKIWYSDSEFKYKVENFDKLQKKYNYHAHIIYSDFDFVTAKSARLNTTELSKMQDITAISLSMQRGISKKKSKVKRLNHEQRKQVSDSIEKEKKLAIREIKKLEESKQKNIQSATDLLIDTKSRAITKNDALNLKIKSLQSELEESENIKKKYIEVERTNKKLEDKLERQRAELEDKYLEIGYIKESHESEINEKNNEIENLNIRYRSSNSELGNKYLELDNIKDFYETEIAKQQKEIDTKNLEIKKLNTLAYSNMINKKNNEQATYKEMAKDYENSYNFEKNKNIELEKRINLLKKSEDENFHEKESLELQIDKLETKLKEFEKKEYVSKKLGDKRIILENTNYSYAELKKIMDDEKIKEDNLSTELIEYDPSWDDGFENYYDEDEGISP